MIKREPLTAELYQRFDGRPPPISMKGTAVMEGGDVIGIIALTRSSGRDFVFAEVTERLKARKREIIRTWKAFIDALPAGRNYYAVRDFEIETSHGFLTHFGFEQIEDDIYIYRSKS